MYMLLIAEDICYVKGFMNELRLHSNESNPENRMTKIDLKELKVITCINKTHLTFRWSTPKLNVFCLEQFMLGDLSENKTC